VFDEEFAEIDFAKTRHIEGVALDFYSRAIHCDLFDDRAKKDSFQIRRLEDVTRAEGVLRYFPEIAAFLKGLFRGFIGEQVLE
jgi:hypothetical protein